MSELGKHEDVEGTPEERGEREVYEGRYVDTGLPQRPADQIENEEQAFKPGTEKGPDEESEEHQEKSPTESYSGSKAPEGVERQEDWQDDEENVWDEPNTTE